MKLIDFELEFTATEIKSDFKTGYPIGGDLYYQCTACGDVLPSALVYADACTCRNFINDADAGRFAVKQHPIKLFKVVKKTKDSAPSA